jgi:hypothetical protein
MAVRSEGEGEENAEQAFVGSLWFGVWMLIRGRPGNFKATPW